MKRCWGILLVLGSISCIWFRLTSLAVPSTLSPPLFERILLGKMETFLALPTNSSPRGIIFAFHGCHHSGIDWFRLPEEGVMVRHALSKRFGILALTSSNRDSGCWSLDDVSLMEEVWTELGLLFPSLPVFGVGASSGGSFLFTLIVESKINFRSAFIQIAPIYAVELPKIPLHLLYMSRREQVTERAYKAIQNKWVRVYEAKPCRLTVERLMQRVYYLEEKDARAILARLHKERAVDEGGFPLLLNDGMGQNYSDAIREELQVCFAAHELSSEYFDQVLMDWEAQLL